MGRSGDVEILRLAGQHQIAHTATNQIGNVVRVDQPIQNLEHVAVDIAARYRMLRPFQQQWFKYQFYERHLDRQPRVADDFMLNLTIQFSRSACHKRRRAEKPEEIDEETSF